MPTDRSWSISKRNEIDDDSLCSLPVHLHLYSLRAFLYGGTDPDAHADPNRDAPRGLEGRANTPTSGVRGRCGLRAQFVLRVGNMRTSRQCAQLHRGGLPSWLQPQSQERQMRRAVYLR